LSHDYYKSFLLATPVPSFSNMGFGFGFDFLIIEGGGGGPSLPSVKIQNINMNYTKISKMEFLFQKKDD
jgi:hypothetical protein